MSGLKAGLALLIVAPVLFWLGVQSYQVWVTKGDSPVMAPLDFMQEGFGACLDSAVTLGCPDVYYGYAGSRPVCARAGFWTCVGLFRADYGYDYLMVVKR